MTIENGGKLEVGGELTGGGANCKCGATVGSTSELIMNSKSGIICDGVIDCYGFIRESSKNNESYITVNTGSVYLPFIISERHSMVISEPLNSFGIISTTQKLSSQRHHIETVKSKRG